MKGYFYAAYLLLFFAVIAYLNHLVPLMPGDDYIFQLKIPDNGIIGTEKINSFSDLFESQVNFYNNYHYRVILHTVLQVLLLLPIYIFDILNAGVFFLLPLLVIKIIPQNNKANLKLLYLMLLSFIWIFHFALGRAYFSTTGALNYSWYLIPQLLFVIELYNRVYGKRNIQFLILTLFVANGNENILLTLCLCVFICFAYKLFILKEKPDYILGLSGGILAIGGIIMLISPSLQWRIAEQGIDFSSLTSRVIEYGKRLVYYLIRYLPLLLILFFGYKRNRLGRLQYYLGFVLLCSSLSMFLAPLFEPRTAVFGFMIFAMIVISLVDWNHGIKNKLVYAVLIVSILVTFFRINLFQKVYDVFPDNITQLEENRNSQKVSLKPQCYNSTSGLIICEEITDDASFIDNRTLAAYYSIDSVILDDKYSTAYRKREFIRKVESDPFLMDSYSKVETKNNSLAFIYFKESESGLELICEVNKNTTLPKKSTVIIRGSRKGFSNHSIIKFLNPNLQLPFLDYLEHTGDHDNKNGSIIQLLDGRKFYYNHVLKPDRYSSFIISLYDIENHTNVGDVYEFSY